MFSSTSSHSACAACHGCHELNLRKEPCTCCCASRDIKLTAAGSGFIDGLQGIASNGACASNSATTHSNTKQARMCLFASLASQWHTV
jgi:hypothetical protein